MISRESEGEKKLVSEIRASSQVEMTFFDFISIIWRRIWLIVGLIVFSLIAIVTFNNKGSQTYEAIAKIGGPLDSDNKIGVALLQSQVLEEGILQQLNLKEYYQVDTLDKARNVLKGNTNIYRSELNSINIAVRDPAPEMSAQIANSYAENLYKHIKAGDFLRKFEVSGFLEERIVQVEGELSQAETNLQVLQAKHGLSPLILLASDDLLIKGFFLEQSRPIEVGSSRNSTLKKSLNHASNKPSFLIPDAVSVSKYRRLKASIQTRENILKFLRLQLEEAKIESFRNRLSFTSLQKAVPSQRAVGTGLKSQLVLGFIVALLVGVFIAFSLEFFERSRKIGIMREGENSKIEI